MFNFTTAKMIVAKGEYLFQGHNKKICDTFVILIIPVRINEQIYVAISK